MITSGSKTEFNLRARLDQLARGECSEDDFLQDVLDEPHAAPDAAWDVLAHIDQHYRRGHLSDDLFRSIETKIARHALKDSGYGRTVNLHPHPEEADDAGDRSVPLHVVAASAAPSTPKTIDLRKPAGTDAAVSDDAWCGRVLSNRYVIEGIIGDGGMGRVFKALDRYRSDLPEPHRHVALKILHRKISEQPNLVANLRREFFFAQSLSHQNIVNVFETDHDGDVAFFTMELLEGDLLSEVIERARPGAIDRSRAYSIIRAIGAGLGHAHARNMVHADLKPQNVMLTRSGEIRILDFGASRPSTRRAAHGTDFQSSVTPAYACCELLAGKAADPRDDLFALGCVSYELLTGRHPFDRKSSTQARDAGIRPLRPDGLTGRQWRALRQALSWRRADRSVSVEDWIERLTTLPSEDPAPPARISKARRTAQLLWKRAGVQRLAAWTVLMAIIAGLALLGHRGREPIGRMSVAAAIPARPSVSAVPRSLPPPAVVAVATPPVESDKKPPPDVAAVPRAPEIAPKPEVRKPVERPANLISVVSYRVSAGQGFAEVGVRRTDPNSADTGFMWWTVTGSAKPGVDFIAQAPTSQLFSHGRKSSTLFIRLLPNPNRTVAREFHVEVGKAGSDDISAPVARATVIIPPQR